MLSQEHWPKLEEAIRQSSGRELRITACLPASGGDTCAAARLQTSAGPDIFLKLAGANGLADLEAEADGLAAMAATRTVRVPQVWATGRLGQRSFLAMEFIALGAAREEASQRTMGRLLAEMHRVAQPYFGWHRNGCIGRTPQINPREDDWPTFYREHRLRFQIQMARRNGLALPHAEALLEHLPTFFKGYSVRPSLLHGDLWGGNAAFDLDATPVLYDPACYFGDREADLAFTEFFGGFSRAFYQGYDETWPRDPGYSARRDLYNLYHVLNHYNIFGGGYGPQAETMMQQLLD